MQINLFSAEVYLRRERQILEKYMLWDSLEEFKHVEVLYFKRSEKCTFGIDYVWT